MLLPVCCLAVPAPHVPSQASRPQLSAHPLAPTLPALPVLPALPSLPNTEGGASFLPSKIMPPINAPAPLMDRGYSLTTSMLAAMQYEAMLKAPAPVGPNSPTCPLPRSPGAKRSPATGTGRSEHRPAPGKVPRLLLALFPPQVRGVDRRLPRALRLDGDAHRPDLIIDATQLTQPPRESRLHPGRPRNWPQPRAPSYIPGRGRYPDMMDLLALSIALASNANGMDAQHSATGRAGTRKHYTLCPRSFARQSHHQSRRAGEAATNKATRAPTHGCARSRLTIQYKNVLVMRGYNSLPSPLD